MPALCIFPGCPPVSRSACLTHQTPILAAESCAQVHIALHLLLCDCRCIFPARLLINYPPQFAVAACCCLLLLQFTYDVDTVQSYAFQFEQAQKNLQNNLGGVIFSEWWGRQGEAKLR